MTLFSGGFVSVTSVFSKGMLNWLCRDFELFCDRNYVTPIFHSLLACLTSVSCKVKFRKK